MFTITLSIGTTVVWTANCAIETWHITITFDCSKGEIVLDGLIRRKQVKTCMIGFNTKILNFKSDDHFLLTYTLIFTDAF